MKFIYAYLFFIIACFGYSQSKPDQSVLDTIITYREFSENKDVYSIDERFSYANLAVNKSKNLGIDTTIIASNNALSKIYYEQRNFTLFKKINLENLELALKVKDSSSIGGVYYNLGQFYRRTLVSDSAYSYYYKAERINKAIHDNFNTVMALYWIADIKRNEKDFIGSEVTSIEALRLLSNLEQTNDVLRRKSYLYNNLGIVCNQLEQFEEAISYHKRSLALKEKLEGDNLKAIYNSKNNLATTYKKSGAYGLAVKQFETILDDENNNLKKVGSNFYALVLDNYAHALYLSKNRKALPGLYIKALKIADSIKKDNYNSIVINQHLSEYYEGINKKDSALYYAYKAKDISKKYHNDDLLKSLLLLSEIETDSIAIKHYAAYVKLNESIIKDERTIRNKFYKIDFQTDQKDQEIVKIAKERTWLLVISIVLIVASFLIYVVITQRNKNKELEFIQKQQETNEEIYNLMLSQHDNIEEARSHEKKRISQELHDGVLGRLFGTRLSLDSLNMSNSVEAIKTRSQYIDELKTIEQDIRKVSHELNTDFVSGSGFVDIIKTLLETQTKVYNLGYKLDHDDSVSWDAISNKNKIHIYRIIQESLHNIHKHANATEVGISFKLKNNVICLDIKDNGSGFDVTKAKSGIGLKNMNSRIKEINGTIGFISEKDIGTTVTVKVPTKL